MDADGWCRSDGKLRNPAEEDGASFSGAMTASWKRWWKLLRLVRACLLLGGEVGVDVAKPSCR